MAHTRPMSQHGPSCVRDTQQPRGAASCCIAGRSGSACCTTASEPVWGRDVELHVAIARAPKIASRLHSSGMADVQVDPAPVLHKAQALADQHEDLRRTAADLRATLFDVGAWFADFEDVAKVGLGLSARGRSSPC